MPLPPLRGGALYDATTVPDTVATPLLSALTNFSTSLLTFACGRDVFSPRQTCADCEHAYRAWLCVISFPRCSEAPPSSSSGNAQTPLRPALVSGSTLRNPNLPSLSGAAPSILQPCLETCNAVDRACPNFIGFRCPVLAFTAAQSYAVGYIDSADGKTKGGGLTGAAQDQWGNVWCVGL